MDVIPQAFLQNLWNENIIETAVHKTLIKFKFLCLQAIITSNGKLTPDYEYIAALREAGR